MSKARMAEQIGAKGADPRARILLAALLAILAFAQAIFGSVNLHAPHMKAAPGAVSAFFEPPCGRGDSQDQPEHGPGQEFPSCCVVCVASGDSPPLRLLETVPLARAIPAGFRRLPALFSCGPAMPPGWGNAWSAQAPPLSS